MQQNRIKLLPEKVSLLIFPFGQPILRKEKNAMQTKRVRHSSPQSGHTSNESTSIKVHYKMQDNVNNAPKELFFQQHGTAEGTHNIYVGGQKEVLRAMGYYVQCCVHYLAISPFLV